MEVKRAMRIMKRLCALLAALLLCAAMILPVGAVGERYVWDEAGILSADETQRLEEMAAEYSRQHGCGIYLATVNDPTISYDVEVRAEEFYRFHQLGLGEERCGILLFLSMYGRDYDLCAYGNTAHDAFTDYGKEKLARVFLDDFADDEWADGFRDYLRECDRYLTLSEQGTPVDVPGARELTLAEKLRNGAGVGGVLGTLVALIRGSVLKSKMKSVRTAQDADEYVRTHGVHISAHSDVFTHTTETRVRIESDSGGRSGGGGGTSINSGGFSHSSGKF